MKFKLGDTVCKPKGAMWVGTVIGTYSTALTPEGYCVESFHHKGSVQIYPAAALEPCTIINAPPPTAGGGNGGAQERQSK